MANDEQAGLDEAAAEPIDALVRRAAGLVDALSRGNPAPPGARPLDTFIPLVTSSRRHSLIRSLRKEIKRPGWLYDGRSKEVLQSIADLAADEAGKNRTLARRAEESKTGTWNFVIAAFLGSSIVTLTGTAAGNIAFATGSVLGGGLFLVAGGCWLLRKRAHRRGEEALDRAEGFETLSRIFGEDPE